MEQGAPPSADPLTPGLLNRLPAPVQKIVLLRASRIGDFINAIPAFRSIRQALPGADFRLITLPMLRPIADRVGIFTRVYDFPGYPGLAEQFFSPARTTQFFLEMQSEAFDLAIQMQGSGVYANPFTLMMGARYTAGFIRPGDPPGRLDAALPFPEKHEADRNLALVSFLGLPAADANPDLPLWPADVEQAAAILRPLPQPWMGIHPSARDATRRWPPERFAATMKALQSIYGGTVLLVGEGQDCAAAASALIDQNVIFQNLAGRTTLPITAAILQKLAVFITNDTGPAHMAYALNTPTVVLFGGGDPARNGPNHPGPFRVLAHPVACRPCETGQCPIDFYCLQQITVEQVVQSAKEIIRLTPNSHTISESVQ